MPEPDNILQKALYLGIGLASYATEKAGAKLQEFKEEADKLARNPDFPQQIQKFADEMVSKGKITAEESVKLVEGMMNQVQGDESNQSEGDRQPRTIEILTDEDEDEKKDQTADVAQISNQVDSFAEKLRDLHGDR